MVGFLCFEKSGTSAPVGESDKFAALGGIVGLVIRDDRIQVEVNLDAARQTELKISSKLLAVATVIGGKK